LEDGGGGDPDGGVWNVRGTVPGLAHHHHVRNEPVHVRDDGPCFLVQDRGVAGSFQSTPIDSFREPHEGRGLDGAVRVVRVVSVVVVLPVVFVTVFPVVP